jgi:hypothetical protein
MASTMQEFLNNALNETKKISEVVGYGEKRHDYTVTLKVSTVSKDEVKAKNAIKKYMQTVGNKKVIVNGMKID